MSGNDKERHELNKIATILKFKTKEELLKIIDIMMKAHCDMDNYIRDLARPYVDVDGDIHDIPSLETIVEGLVKIIELTNVHPCDKCIWLGKSDNHGLGCALFNMPVNKRCNRYSEK